MENGEVIEEEEAQELESRRDCYSENLKAVLQEIQQFKKRRVKQLRLIISMIYNAILRIPDITSSFFEKEQKVEPFFKIFYGNYPLDLQIICMNFLSELANHIPFQFFNRFEDDLERIKVRLL